LVGLAGVARRRQTDRGRVVLAASACGLVTGGLWAWDPNPRVVGPAAAVLALGTAAWVLAGSARVVAVVGAVRRPAVRSGLLAVAGLGCVVGSVVRYEAEDARITDTSMQDIVLICATPPLDVVEGAGVTTDGGSAVVLKRPTEFRPADELASSERNFLDRSQYHTLVVRRRPPDETTNCHGWVFAAGRFWVGGGQVDAILKENRYAAVSDPQPGDLVVYRNYGDVTHTAVVRYVTPGQIGRASCRERV